MTEDRSRVMALARRRIELLRERGRLSGWAARLDLKAVDYLERHPDRAFPDDARAWIREIGMFFAFHVPGPMGILRVLLFGGVLPEPSRSRALRACSVYAGVVLAVLEYAAMMGLELFERISSHRGLSLHNLGNLANMALVFTGAGILMAVGLFFTMRRELRKMDGWVQELD